MIGITNRNNNACSTTVNPQVPDPSPGQKARTLIVENQALTRNRSAFFFVYLFPTKFKNRPLPEICRDEKSRPGALPTIGETGMTKMACHIPTPIAYTNSCRVRINKTRARIGRSRSGTLIVLFDTSGHSVALSKCRGDVLHEVFPTAICVTIDIQKDTSLVRSYSVYLYNDR